MLNEPSLDRFAVGRPDPQARSPKPLTECAQCGREMYRWDECIKYGDEYFCSPRCVMDYLAEETPGAITKPKCAMCGYEFQPEDDLIIYDGQLFCAPADNGCLYRYLEKHREVSRCYVEEV